jgi:hypothetical protein
MPISSHRAMVAAIAAGLSKRKSNFDLIQLRVGYVVKKRACDSVF